MDYIFHKKVIMYMSQHRDNIKEIVQAIEDEVNF